MKDYKNIIFLLALIGVVESIYIYFQPTPRDGLELLFLLPLVFSFCVIYFGKYIIPYQRKGFGLKVYYSIVILRFLIQPYFIVLSEGELGHRMPFADSESYPIAIFIYFIEIIIACSVIKKWYPIYFKKNYKQERKRKTIQINNYGKFIIIVYVCFLLLRIQYWLPAMKIMGIKEASNDMVIVFDATIFNCIKVILFIFFVVKSKYYTHNSFNFRLYFTLAILFGLFNFLSYFGSNRSFIYETAVATIVILIHVYPNYKNRVLAILIPFAISIMFYSYVTKQFAEENQNVISSVSTEVATSNVIEEYSNGLWTVAKSYEASKNIKLEDSFVSLTKDFVDGFAGLADLPGMKAITEAFSDLNSSSDIFKTSLGLNDDMGQMLSLSGGFLINGGGGVLGWFFLLLGNYLLILLLVTMEVKSKVTKDIYHRYMYIWMAILLGLVHCYCLQTIIYCWSKFILFYWLFLFFNGLGIKKKRFSF